MSGEGRIRLLNSWLINGVYDCRRLAMRYFTIVNKSRPENESPKMIEELASPNQ